MSMNNSQENTWKEKCERMFDVNQRNEIPVINPLNAFRKSSEIWYLQKGEYDAQFNLQLLIIPFIRIAPKSFIFVDLIEPVG